MLQNMFIYVFFVLFLFSQLLVSHVLWTGSTLDLVDQVPRLALVS